MLSERMRDLLVPDHKLPNEEWHRIRDWADEVAQLEMRIAIQYKTILAHENDTACLPEDYSVTEYVQHLEAKAQRLQKEINDLADIIRIKDAIDAERI